MISHTEYARARLEQVSRRLHERVYPETRPAEELVVSPPVGRIGLAGAERLDFRPARLGDRFGPAFATYWFRVGATVPEAWAGARIDLLWQSASEGTVWRDGRLVAGLNPHHGEVTLVDAAQPGWLGCWIELACNGLFGTSGAPVELSRCELGRFDPAAWRVACDFELLRCLERHPATEPSWSAVLRRELERFCDSGDPAILEELFERRNATHAPALVATGHAHLDTAWLWPLAETFRKLQRTLGTALRYMDEYPEYRFAFSQAQHYAWIAERDAALWARLRAQVAAGRVVPVGGTWVEPDLILPSGESLVRQLLLGQRFFERELGVRCREFWAPDAFGYPGQLPQLIRGAGMTRFLTQKLSWNRFTRPEHHTFIWQGDDGSEVLAHFPPADTYSSAADVDGLLRSVRDHRFADPVYRGLLLFGHGDGGGGPTRGMLETLRRAGDLQGLPRTRMGTPAEFFGEVEAAADPLPVSVGELYLEYHRGTYTSQAFVKRANRECEQGLHDAEFLGVARGDYDRAELGRLRRLLALQQFHDILPGSSIRAVYEDAERDFAVLRTGIEALIGDGPTPVNTTGFPRREVAGDRILAAAPYAAASEVEADDEVGIDGLTLENRYLRATLSPDGTLARLVHRPSGREVLAGRGNVLELYDDDPVEFDAWDIDPYTLATGRPAPAAESWELVTATRLRAEIAFERQLSDSSRMRQVVRLDAGAGRLEFRTVVDWHERHKLLKACFPLSVRAPMATYESAFGYAERATHYSTAADRARYEVPGHRFADLSEHGFGVALLTDCKYGYSCHGSALRVSLLRAPKSPDPEADMGRHEFAYALHPHAGGWREAWIVREAALFNAPLRWTRLDRTEPLAAVQQGELVLDTIKLAEDSDELVLRLYEPHGGRGTARVRLGVPFRCACRTNLLEEERDGLAVEAGGVIVIPYAPHEVLTVKAS